MRHDYKFFGEKKKESSSYLLFAKSSAIITSSERTGLSISTEPRGLCVLYALQTPPWAALTHGSFALDQ